MSMPRHVQASMFHFVDVSPCSKNYVLFCRCITMFKELGSILSMPRHIQRTRFQYVDASPCSKNCVLFCRCLATFKELRFILSMPHHVQRTRFHFVDASPCSKNYVSFCRYLVIHRAQWFHPVYASPCQRKTVFHSVHASACSQEITLPFWLCLTMLKGDVCSVLFIPQYVQLSTFHFADASPC